MVWDGDGAYYRKEIYSKGGISNMTGFGRAYSAVTVLNAFATGIGSAIGIDLKVEIKISESENKVIRIYLNHRPLSLETKLINIVLDYFKLNYGLDENLEIDIFSEIPPEVGLKSSSAVVNALIEAILDHLHMEADTLTKLHLNTKLSIEAGVSLTGALDDAAASLLGGFVVTDNNKNRILKWERLDEEDVAILYPEIRIPTKKFIKWNFSPIKKYVKKVEALVVKGEWRKAAILNGLIYGSYLGYDLNPLLDALRNKALAAGLSGKGPAFYMIGGDIDSFIQTYSGLQGLKVLKTRVRSGDGFNN